MYKNDGETVHSYLAHAISCQKFFFGSSSWRVVELIAIASLREFGRRTSLRLALSMGCKDACLGRLLDIKNDHFVGDVGTSNT